MYWVLIAAGCLALGLFLDLLQLAMTFAIEGVPLDLRSPSFQQSVTIHVLYGLGIGLGFYLLFVQKERRLRMALREQRRAGMELRRLHAQFVQSEKLSAVGQLAAGIAHELNNPLQAILAYAALNAEKAKALASRLHEPEVEGIARNAIAVQEASQRSAKIVRNLLAFARKDGTSMTTVDLNDLARSTVELLGHTLGLRNVKIGFDPEPGPLHVRGNPVALRQVFTNLLLNARDAMPSGGTVALSARRVDGSVEISVRDSGCGMGPDVKAHIFEPFFTTKPPGEGTGLGLSMAYSIVKEHGGSIGVESEPGKGSTFTLRFPAMNSPDSPGAATRDSVPAPGGAA